MRVKIHHHERPWIYDVDLDGGVIRLRQCPSMAGNYVDYWLQDAEGAFLPLEKASKAFVTDLPHDYLEWLPDQ